MKVFTKIIFALLFLVVSSEAYGEIKPCEIPLLSDTVHHFAPSSDTLSYTAFQVVETRPGTHGGHRIVVKRTGSWFDFEKEIGDRGDLVIDLRFFPHVLGEEVARFFGYEILNDRHIVIPDVDELNGAIAKFNSSLPEGDSRRILLQYYPIPGVHNSVNEYINMFNNNLAIPISQEGKSFFHDMSVHSLQGFFVDNDIVVAVHQRVSITLRVVEHLKEVFQGSSIENDVKKVSHEVKSSLTGLVDQIGGLVGLMAGSKMRSYFAQIGVAQHNEGVTSPMGAYLPRAAHIFRNGGISGLNLSHFGWIINQDFQTTLHDKIMAAIDKALKNSEHHEHVQSQLEKTMNEYFSLNQDMFVGIVPVNDLIESAEALKGKVLNSGSMDEEDVRPTPTRGSVLKSVIGRIWPRSRSRSPLETQAFERVKGQDEFESTLSEYRIAQAFLDRLTYLRENIDRLSSE